MKEKVLFIHYRSRERDGVSLEMEHRVGILEELGHKTFYITGNDGLGKGEESGTYQINEFDLKTTYNKFLRDTFFSTSLLDEQSVVSLYYQLETEICKKLNRVFESIKPDLVFVHNMFSVPFNLPATTALIKIMDKFEIPTVVHSPDFWFTRSQFLDPKYPFIKDILETLPPKRDYIIKHQVINSIEGAELEKRRGIKAQQISDAFDFSENIPQIDKYNGDLKEVFGISSNDLVITHATRITRRKSIENAIIFAHELERKLKKYGPVSLPNKTTDKDSKVVLFFPNFVESDDVPYFEDLVELADKLNVKAIWASERFLPERQVADGIKKYSFWDSYVIADLITYTSDWEGFGNQFLEAVFFKKLIVLFEYPVFEKDIKNEGYKYVSLGNKYRLRNNFKLVNKEVITNAVDDLLDLLIDKEKANKIVERNFQIAKKFHDISILKKDLEDVLSCIRTK